MPFVLQSFYLEEPEKNFPEYSNCMMYQPGFQYQVLSTPELSTEFFAFKFLLTALFPKISKDNVFFRISLPACEHWQAEKNTKRAGDWKIKFIKIADSSSIFWCFSNNFSDFVYGKSLCAAAPTDLTGNFFQSFVTKIPVPALRHGNKNWLR